MEVTLYDILFKEVYIKYQLNIILLSRPLGATRCCSNLHDHIYKVPAHYCIMTRPLGATLVEVLISIRQLQVPGFCKHDNPTLGGYICGIFSLWLMIEMNNPDFFKVATLILKQLLSYHYVLLLRLEGYRYYAYKEGTSSNSQLWVNQEDQLHDPGLTTMMTRHHQSFITRRFWKL